MILSYPLGVVTAQRKPRASGDDPAGCYWDAATMG